VPDGANLVLTYDVCVGVQCMEYHAKKDLLTSGKKDVPSRGVIPKRRLHALRVCDDINLCFVTPNFCKDARGLLFPQETPEGYEDG
jgi:hypothetical protein